MYTRYFPSILIIKEEVPKIWEFGRSDTAARVDDSERGRKKEEEQNQGGND